MKCECGRYVPKGNRCNSCLEKDMRKAVGDQTGSEKLTVLIGNLLAKETADAIGQAYDNFASMELKARGRHISRAVDVLEILKRNHNFKYEVTSGTAELTSYEGSPIRVSEITVTITKILTYV